MLRAFLYIGVCAVLLSCNSEDETPEIESMENAEVDTEIADKNAGLTSEDQLEWHFYAGRMGPYEQKVILELGLFEEEVSGRYFYAKHQQFIAITGKYDSIQNQLSLTESYNGNITGYIEASVDAEGILTGSWSKVRNGEKQPFMAKPLNLALDESEQMDVRFLRFEKEHTIEIFDGMDTSTEPDLDEVKDELALSRLDNKHFGFYYQVVGSNSNIGILDGVATVVDKNYAIYTNPNDGCLLSFRFFGDSIEIQEEENCSATRGLHSEFSNRLGKSSLETGEIP